MKIQIISPVLYILLDRLCDSDIQCIC